MNLRKGIKKQNYKTEIEWLNAIYDKNKDLIDSKLFAIDSTPREQFIGLVKEYRDEGFTPLKAVDALEKSTLFTGIKDRLVNNAYKAIKEDKEAYQTFRNLTKNEKGQYTKVDFSQFEYQKGQYIYHHSIKEGDKVIDKSLVIDFTNSPYNVEVRSL